MSRFAVARRKPFLAATLALAAGLLVAVAFERVYDVRIRARAPDPLALVTNDPPDRSNRSPLTLRMVDIGGVGISLDSWGDNYSHDRSPPVRWVGRARCWVASGFLMQFRSQRRVAEATSIGSHRQ
jgi:hypothetical protein